MLYILKKAHENHHVPHVSKKKKNKKLLHNMLALPKLHVFHFWYIDYFFSLRIFSFILSSFSLQRLCIEYFFFVYTLFTSTIILQAVFAYRILQILLFCVGIMGTFISFLAFCLCCFMKNKSRYSHNPCHFFGWSSWFCTFFFFSLYFWDKYSLLLFQFNINFLNYI